jgi:hypothetical protein
VSAVNGVSNGSGPATCDVRMLEQGACSRTNVSAISSSGTHTAGSYATRFTYSLDVILAAPITPELEPRQGASLSDQVN